MFISFWGIYIGIAVIAVLIAKIFHLLFRIEKLEELLRKMEGIGKREGDQEDEDEEHEKEEKRKKSILDLDDIDERRDSGGG